jgi:hypothetical protein
LTRAQAAVILVRALGLENENGILTYSDVVGHWARKEIDIARRYKIVYGIGDGKFGPDIPITREEMSAMLDRILTVLNEPADSSNPYKDVNMTDSAWSYNSILKLSYYGIFSGYPDGKFHPGDNITRAEMAASHDNRYSTGHMGQTEV